MLPTTRRRTLVLSLLAVLAAHCGSSVSPSNDAGNEAAVDVPLIDSPAADAPLIDSPAADAPRPDVPAGDAADVPTADAPDGEGFDVPAADAPDSEGIDVPPADVPTSDVPTSDVPPGPSGDCRTDADCFSGRCVEITPGGYRECYAPPNVATDCQQPGLDQCACNGATCPDGQVCLATPAVPFCSGVAMQSYNQCAQDECASDADCASTPNQLCAPAGTLDRQVRACVTAFCKVDGDCTAQSGGICAPVRDACCGAEQGLFCVYPSGGCRSNSDCQGNSHCEPDYSTGEGRCVQGPALCPA